MRSDARIGNVWLASYPKSGNTWMRLALTSLMRGGGGVDINGSADLTGVISANRRSFDRMLDIDSSDLTHDEISRLQPRVYDLCASEPGHAQIWKTHDAWVLTSENEPLFPPETTAATVYLVRDPRDVAISFAHHFDRSIDAAIDLMASDLRFAYRTDRLELQLPQKLHSWSRHVESWLDHAVPTPLMVRYEDMVSDFATQLTRVAAAMKLSCDASSIAGAVAATRFETLKKQEEREGFRQRTSRTNPFFRRGISGGWRDSLTSSQVFRIERDHGPMMQRLGYL